MLNIKLPGLNCGSCGFKTCLQFYEVILKDQAEIKRCVYMNKMPLPEASADNDSENAPFINKWVDSLGREFDFILEPFKEKEGGILEFIHPFNTNIIADLKLKKGDIIIGRPLAAGCPVTHCGKIMDIDLSGIIKWSVIGPLTVRNKPFLDIGNYLPFFSGKPP